MMVASFQNREIPQSHVEHLRKQAAKMKGKPRNRESVEKGRASQMGHEVDIEARAKMAAKWADPVWRAATVAKMTGKKRPDGFGARMGAMRKGKPLSIEHKKAVSLAMTGKKRGPYKKKNREYTNQFAFLSDGGKQ